MRETAGFRTRFSESTGQWTLERPFAASPTWTWRPGAGEVGRHYLQVWVRRQGSTVPYEAWAEAAAIDVTTQPLALTLHSSQGDPPGVPADTPIQWRAFATGASAPLEYQVWRFDGQNGNWNLAVPYGPSDTYVWTPTRAEAGVWYLQVWVRRVGSSAAYEAWAGQAFIIQP